MVLPSLSVQASAASRTDLEPRAIGSAYTQVDLQQIRAGQMVSAREALLEVPGVAINAERPGEYTSVSIRGSDTDQVLVLLDGIELGDPSATSTQFQFDHLTTLDIDRIEVLRGNQSSLYGSDAIGGVINILTQRATEDGIRLNLEGEGGSYGHKRGGGSLLGRQGPVDFRFTFHGQSVDGPSQAKPVRGPSVEDDPSWQYGFSGRLGVQVLPNLYVEALGFQTLTDHHYDNTGQDGFDTVDKDEDAMAFRATHTAWDGRWTNQLLFSTYHAERRYFAGYTRPDGDVYDGTKRNINFITRLKPLDIVSVAAGFDLEREETTQVTNFSGDFVAGIDTHSGFGEIAVEPVRDLTLTAALRHDSNSRFGGFDTWRGTVAYFVENVAPDADLKLRASYGTGAKAPGLYQLFDPLYGNERLTVEESRGWDVGVDAWWRDMALELTWFQTDVTNEIDFDFAQGGYIQRGETETSGVELGFTAAPTPWLMLRQTYTYLLADDVQLARTLGRPRHVGATTVTVLPLTDLSLSARVRYRSFNASSSGGRTDGFATVDLLASYRLDDQWEVYGRVVNLFDQDYQLTYGYQPYPLTAYLGLRTSLGLGGLEGLFGG
ncbi:TonB-dependent receptor domain-containing protein [Zavarzinia sp. CC-PAN008]|uniref:TonB-dependent receptor domain-containing protein n=1 Tax=Zavarzinia sp. CC-PAN008 TaxID=3243332 RepID=UPI003F748473